MTTTDTKGQIVPREKAARTLASELMRLKPEIAHALPGHIDPDRMTRVCLTALRTTPNLNKCTLPSFLGSVLQLAQIGLEPNTPLQHAFLIPRKKGSGYECTTMIGYQGYLDLMYRSGKVALIYAEVVRDGDGWDCDKGLNRILVHKPIAPHSAPLIRAYAVAELTNNHKAFEVLEREDINKRKKSSQSSGSEYSPWNTFEEEMWRKSAVRALAKYMPKSPELASAVTFDEAPEYGAKQTEYLTDEARAALEAKGIDPEGDEVGDDA